MELEKFFRGMKNTIDQSPVNSSNSTNDTYPLPQVNKNSCIQIAPLRIVRRFIKSGDWIRTWTELRVKVTEQKTLSLILVRNERWSSDANGRRLTSIVAPYSLWFVKFLRSILGNEKICGTCYYSNLGFSLLFVYQCPSAVFWSWQRK